MEQQQLYDKYQEGRHWEHHPTVYAERYALFLREINFHGLLVDIGCGNGRDVVVFQSNGFQALGMDNSEKEIDSARTKHPECKFEVQDVEQLQFKENSVGAYFMINVIHYVKKEKAMNEIYRTLKKGGHLFIHFNLDIIDDEGKVDYHHDEEDIAKLISKFKIIQERKFERVDTVPKTHTHRILELILQK